MPAEVWAFATSRCAKWWVTKPMAINACWPVMPWGWLAVGTLRFTCIPIPVARPNGMRRSAVSSRVWRCQTRAVWVQQKPHGLWRKPYPRPAAPVPRPRNKRAFQPRHNRSLFKNQRKNPSLRFGLLRQAFRFHAAPRRLLITKMTSAPVTLSWRCAKVSSRSNTSSVTPPWVLAQTKVS